MHSERTRLCTELVNSYQWIKVIAVLIADYTISDRLAVLNDGCLRVLTTLDNGKEGWVILARNGNKFNQYATVAVLENGKALWTIPGSYNENSSRLDLSCIADGQGKWTYGCKRPFIAYTESWTTSPAHFNGDLIVGLSRESLNQLFKFSPISQKWETLPPLNKIYHSGTITSWGKIYIYSMRSSTDIHLHRVFQTQIVWFWKILHLRG